MKYILPILLLAAIGCASHSPTSVITPAAAPILRAGPMVDSIYVIGDMLCVDVVNGSITSGEIGGWVSFGKPPMQASLPPQALVSSPPTYMTYTWGDYENIGSATIILTYTIRGVQHSDTTLY